MAQIGSTLRGARVQRGLTIEQVAQDTRISARFLEALEAETFEDLPAPVYVRGFLRSYANFLHVDPAPLLESLAQNQSQAQPNANGNGSSRNGTNGNGRRGGPRPDPFARNAGRSGAPVYPPSVPIGPPLREETWDPDEIGPDPRNEPRAAGRPVATFEPAAPIEDDELYFDEPIPYRPRAVSGILTETDEGGRDPAATSRVLGIIAGIAIATIAILALAVFLTGRGGDNGGANNAAATNTDTPSPRPAGSVIALASVTAAGSATASVTASASPSASVTGTVSPATTAGTPTPTKSAGAAASTATATETPTPGESATPVSTATPTVFRTATPTRVPTPPPHPLAYGACDLTKSIDQCGAPPVRVVCYPPFPVDEGRDANSNWFVDIPQTYPLQPGWKESFVVPTPGSIGKIIDVGQHGC